MFALNCFKSDSLFIYTIIDNPEIHPSLEATASEENHGTSLASLFVCFQEGLSGFTKGFCLYGKFVGSKRK
jgi:hypothetical protein